MASLLCTRCGASQSGVLRHCQRCSLALRPAGLPATSASLKPLVAAARHPEQVLAPLVAGQGGRPLVVQQAADTALPVPLRPGAAAVSGLPPGRPRAVRALAWATGGLVGCGALLLGAQFALPLGAGIAVLAAVAPDLAATAPLALPDETDAAAAMPVEQANRPRPPPASPPATDPAALAQAINGVLQEQGMASVRASVSDAGTATLSGQVPAGSDAAELLQWVASLPGVNRVEAALTPAPPAVHRLARPAPAADDEDTDAASSGVDDSAPAGRGLGPDLHTETTTVRTYRQTR